MIVSNLVASFIFRKRESVNFLSLWLVDVMIFVDEEERKNNKIHKNKTKYIQA